MASNCELCGEPMPEGEETFRYHGFSGPCPKPYSKKQNSLSPTQSDKSELEELLDRYELWIKTDNPKHLRSLSKPELIAALSAREEQLVRQAELRAKLAVASNAKIFTNKHGATYIVFKTEDRDVSQNELTAIFYQELNDLNRIDTTLRLTSHGKDIK